ncbi:MAG: hypothetical protein ACE5JN_16340 [Candidatus Methylomirabilia bacterium]
MVELERRGVPTVILTAAAFVRDAERSAQSFGLPGLPLAVIPLPLTNQPPESIRKMVDGCFEDIIGGLTQPVRAPEARPDTSGALDERLIFEEADLLEASAAMDRRFLEAGWSDGFPVVPPTPRAVEAMLRGTSRGPDELIAVLEPGFGRATVERLAINAVMAGCRPEHLPVLIAAVRCLADPRMYLRNKAMSTGPHAPLVVVNGPKAQALGINSRSCALGPGAVSAVNTVLGRAVRLIMMNVGHTYPGVSDMDTIGSPAKYSLCVAENEAESPWEPYHVGKGYPREASTVTVQFVYGLSELFDFANHLPERLVEVFATAATNVAAVGTGLWLIGRRGDPRYKTEEKEHNTLLICPEHAQRFAAMGWSKADLQQALYRAARLPFRILMLNKEPEALAAAHPELAWLWENPDVCLPVVETPDCFDIAVVGGAAGRGIYCYGAGGPVTMPID